jgi:hypothetical protein
MRSQAVSDSRVLPEVALRGVRVNILLKGRVTNKTTERHTTLLSPTYASKALGEFTALSQLEL